MKCLTGVILIVVGLVWCQDEVKKMQPRDAGNYYSQMNRDQPINDFALPEDQYRRGYYTPPPFPHHHHHGPPPDSFVHHHHHSYHRQDTDQTTEKIDTDTNTTIPLDFAISLNDYIASDLMLNAIEDTPEDLKPAAGGVKVSTRFGDTEDTENTERGAAQIARPAKCMPELQTVPTVESNERNVFYAPECTRIERCGGCCSHVLLSCQPEDTELVTFSVLKTAFNDANKRLKYVGKIPITLERHTKCKCKCKVKETDCTAYQEYRESECRCVCKNIDEERKCYKSSGLKLWNPDQCSCDCREVQPCSTGFDFDHNECRCLQSQLRRRYVISDPPKEEPEP